MAIILSIVIVIGAFAGLSFNLFSANATDYVGDGTNVAYNATGANTSNAAVFSANISTNYVNGTTEKKGANIVEIRATGAGQDGEGYYAKPNTASFTWSGSNNDWRNATAFYFEYGNKITAGDKYVISAYVRLAETATDVKAYFATADLSGRLFADSRSQKSADVAISTEWTKVEWVIETASATADKFLGLVISKPVAVDFDAISLQKAVAAATPTPVATPAIPETDGIELILNGNANQTASSQVSTSEGKSGGFWAKPNGASQKVPVVAYTDKDGNGLAFKVEPRSSNGNGLRAWYPDALFPAGKFVLEYWLKADSALDVKLAIKKGGYPESADVVQVASITAGDWTQFAYVIEVAEAGKYVFGFLTDDTTSSATTFYIDNISLQAAKAPAAPEVVVGDGNELVADGKAPATAGDTVTFNGQKVAHFKTGGGTSQFNIGQDSVAGTDADGNGRYFAVAKIELTDAQASNSVLRNRIPFVITTSFEEGIKYVVSAYVKLPAASLEAVTAQLTTCGTFPIQVAEPSKVVNKSAEVALTTEWQKIEFAFEASADDKHLGLVLNTPAAVDVDTISIQKAAGQGGSNNEDKYTENLLTKHANGSFNKGSDIAPMYQTEKTKWAVEVISGQSQDNDGFCAKITARGEKYAIARSNVTEIMKAYGAGKYTFSFYIKAESASAKAITIKPLAQMVWGEAYNNDNLAAGTTVGKWAQGANVQVDGAKWTQVTLEFEFAGATNKGGKGDDLNVREVLLYAQDDAFNALFAENLLVDNMSLIKEINGKEDQALIAQLSGAEGNQGGSNAGSSNTGDVLPVALIAVAVVSAGALVVVARRKREE